MPELPDITLYLDALRARVLGTPLIGVRLTSPFLLRTAVPALTTCHGRSVEGLFSIGKRIVFELSGEHFMALHLMIAGRLHYLGAGANIPGRNGLAAFDFPQASLVLTEASKKRRAALHVFDRRSALDQLDPGGLDVLTADYEDFAAAIRRQNHTLKRTLTDPKILSGIGNAYSDEILHAAQLSPVLWSNRLSDLQARLLFGACTSVLTTWTGRLRAEAGGEFPERVTAFRPAMAVHGRYRQPCPRCGQPVQRIAYANNETNYCPTCQTGGKLLADRALSRLLRKDWPKTVTELEETIEKHRERHL